MSSFSASLRLCGSRFCALGLLCVLLLTGCAGQTAVVSIKPVSSNQSLRLEFTRACYSRQPSGEDEIVLENDPLDQPPSAPAGAPLPPVTDPPIWQVLDIQLHWRSPTPGVKDSPVADNAVLHWYVYGKPDGLGTSVLQYVGTGTVTLSADTNRSGGANVSIRNAELHLAEKHGSLLDPLVDFRITTAFHAADDPAHLKGILEDLHKALVDAQMTSGT